MPEKPTYEELEQRVRQLEKAESERKRAEEALHTEKHFSDSAIESLPGIFYLFTKEGKFLRWNKNFQLLTGYSSEAFSRKHPLDFFPADEQPLVKERIGEVFSKGESFVEASLILKDGTKRLYYLTGVRMDISGTPCQVGMGIDIADRRQAEEAIKRSETMQSKMAANIGDVIVVIDQEGINRYKSPNIEKIFGWKPEDVVGTSTWDNVHPEDLASAQKFIETLMLEPESVGTMECRYKCRDGHYKWIQLTGSNLLHDPDICGILGNYHDITDRKQAEEQLRESESRFKALHNASFGGIAIHDKGIVLECNQGLSEMFCYPEAELIGMDGLLLVSEKSRGAVMKNILSGYQEPYEAYGLRKNGDVFPMRLEARNIPYKGNNVRIVEFRDISKEKQAEAERKELLARLTQAQKMESIGTLAGGIAHDFNNILHPIIGYAEMLLEDISENSQFRNSISEILAGSMRASELVKQILTFSRQKPVQIKPMRVQPIIKEVFRLIRSAIPTSIEIKQHVSTSCGVIKADPTQIHQVVMNLSTNAYHAMLSTGGQLKVSLKEVELSERDMLNPGMNLDMKPGPYACLTVSDTGVGMDKDVTEKIFEPFFTTKEKSKGTGMGLSVVHGIVHSAGGSIQVNSEPGKGTDFHVCLPVVKNDSAKPEPRIKETIQRGTEQILIVDDEKAIVAMETKLLERLGYNVISCTGSLEALEAFRASPDKFDLIITDMAMPNMSGDKLAEKVKKIRPDIPVILVSGFSEKIKIRTGPDCQVDGFLMKPADKASLAKTIRKLLDAAETSH